MLGAIGNLTATACGITSIAGLLTPTSRGVNKAIIALGIVGMALPALAVLSFSFAAAAMHMTLTPEARFMFVQVLRLVAGIYTMLSLVMAGILELLVYRDTSSPDDDVCEASPA